MGGKLHKWFQTWHFYWSFSEWPRGKHGSERVKVNELTALSVVADDLFDLCNDVLNVGGDVADGGVQSLVHLGGQVLDVGDELLHLAEDVDQLEGRAQLGVACRRTQRSQQVESRPLCGREWS